MAYKHYNRLLIFRLCGVVLLPLLIGFLIAMSQSVFLLIFLSGLELILIFELVRFLNKTNRQINFFIQAIKNDDTTLRFPIKTGNSIISDLHQSLNELNVILQQTKVRSQIKERYFSEILQNIGTGVMVYNEKGFVTEVNTAALDLFGLQNLTHLSQIDRVDTRFRVELTDLSNLQKQVITLRKANEQVQIITRCSVINLKDENVKLITLQDIRGELERKELDSWVKLIRVLSHEIMNSLAPVTSIAQSLQGIWKDKIENTPTFAGDEAVDSTIRGLEVIGERGEGLIRFVQSYRMLTKVPVPKLAGVEMKNLFDRLSILVSPLKAEFEVLIKFHYPEPDFQLLVDEQMLVQVVINLVKNAAEALADTTDPLIEISGRQLSNSQTEITVSDNGPGIPDEIIEEIFVPFFTTKATGTGIGLSYSRQLMRAHGGTINCSSHPGKTVFKLQV
jgi:two-component system, NtrC family, nitrogen regulation sensor histidine kinase NtrY